jgi:DNA-binding response OmpR family regulator
MKILVVEDERKIADLVRKALEASGFIVETCNNGDDALTWASRSAFDALVLDIMIPGRDGLSVLRQLRSAGNTTPVLLLTARSSLDERIEGLNLGADDYVTKPFGIGELMARIAALLRRHRRVIPDVVTIGSLEVDRGARRVSREGVEIELTPKEYGLLEFFTRKSGRALTREQILDAVWGDSAAVTDRSVDRAVTTLRSKIEENPNRPSLIQTVPQVGYRFEG